VDVVPLYIKVMLHFPAVGKTRRVEDDHIELPPLFHSVPYILGGILGNTGIRTP